MVRSVIICVLAGVLGCAGTDTSSCGDGICPPGLECVRDALRSEQQCTSAGGFMSNDTCQVCVLSTCGNGNPDPGEECDDGNRISGDGCPVTCGAACSDGVVDPDESCDDGNLVGGDGCARICREEVCGSGFVDEDEACDDGNTSDRDGCSNVCAAEQFVWLDTTDAPPSRSRAAMAYDARRGRAVLFGGCGTFLDGDCVETLGDTWEWDGAVWMRVAVGIPSPSPRYGHTMVFDAATGVITMDAGCDRPFNGQCGSLHETWQWDGAEWTQRPVAWPGALEGHATVYDSSRHQIVKFGGIDWYGSRRLTNETYVWNGSEWSTVTTTAPPVRTRHAMTFDPARGVVVLFGGEGAAATLDDTWEWNGSEWTERHVVGPPPRAGHTMTYDTRRKRIVAFGGCSTTSSPCTALDDVWEWDGTTWSERVEKARPPARSDLASVTDPQTGASYIFGGATDRGLTTNDAWELDQQGWQVRNAAAPSRRSSMAMIYDSARASLLLAGGRVGSFELRDAWQRIDGVWRSSVILPGDRVGMSMVFDSRRNRVVAFGGWGNGTLRQDTWEFDGASWQLLSPTRTPPTRAYHGMAFDAARGKTVLFGGCRATSVQPGAACDSFDDTWTWDGTQWTQAITPVHPSSRSHLGMTYDTVRERIVLFGGANVTTHADTWEWTGTAWELRTSTTTPSPRAAHALAFDPIRGASVLFGGCSHVSTEPPVFAEYDCTNRLDDTWLWNGTAWTPLASPRRPPARVLHAMTFDASTGKTLLVGGLDFSFHPLADSWELDATGWNAVSPLRPDFAGGSAEFDELRGEVVLLAGPFATSVSGQMWTWNGKQWKQRKPQHRPSTRSIPSMSFDRDRGVIVLVAGVFAPDPSAPHFFDETWEWDGSDWSLRSTDTPWICCGMAYDAANRRTVIAGTSHDSEEIKAFAWDGSVWTEITAPPSMTTGSLGYDEERDRLVWLSTNGEQTTTWELEQGTWLVKSEVPLGAAPVGVSLHWDSARKRIVAASSSADLIWEWNGTTWTRLDASLFRDLDGGTRAFDRVRRELVAFGGFATQDNSDETWILRSVASPESDVCRTGFEHDQRIAATCDDERCEYACFSCGNGACEAFESCRSCPSDCGACDTCGDLHCDASESCTSCPGDCNACP